MTQSSKVANKWGEFALKIQNKTLPAKIFHGHSPVVKEFLRKYHYGKHGLPIENLLRLLAERKNATVLEIGCGRGDLSMTICKTGFCERIDSYDITPECIAIAEEKAQQAGFKDVMNFEIRDLNSLTLKKDFYDVVVANSVLHHIENLEQIFKEIHSALKPDGRFYFNDYVGPNRMQWSNKQLEIMNELLNILPEKYHRTSVMDNAIVNKIKPIPLEIFEKHDPSEGVRSSDIIFVAEQFFDFEIYHPAGQSVVYELLRGRVHNFSDDDPLEQTLLKLLTYIDYLCLSEGILESDFAFGVLKRKAS